MGRETFCTHLQLDNNSGDAELASVFKSRMPGRLLGMDFAPETVSRGVADAQTLTPHGQEVHLEHIDLQKN